jgi:class 3 adenylate cyclase
VTNYFIVPRRALSEGAFIAAQEPPGEARRALMEKFSVGAMKEVSQIEDFIVGDAAGDFTMFRRGDNGGIDTKLISNPPGARKVTWIHRNAAGDEIGREEDPTDTYDPRTRPWYSGALATSSIFWTDVYIFFTGKEPGITASTRYLSPEGRNFVIGVDITLANLSNFLAGLKIGESGRAMIIGTQGQVIAYPQMERIVKQDRSGPVSAVVDEIGDTVAVGAYDRFRVNGPGHETITVDGKRHLTSLTPLPAVGHDWSVMIVAPENDFIGFVEHSNRNALLMSLAIVALAAIGGVLLVWQGLRGDRAIRLVRDRGHAMARQSAALGRVADEAGEFDPAHPERSRALTEAAAEVTGARRVNVWYLQADRDVLHCADSFDREGSHHSDGFEVHRDELPHFFDQVVAGTALEVEDAANDPRTAEVYRATMAPLGSRALSIVPMRGRGNVVGAIGLHDPADITTDARHCLRVLAGIAAMRAGDGTGAPRAAEVEVIPAVAEPEALHSFATDLSLPSVDVADRGEGFYPGIAVLMLRIGEEALAANRGAGSPELLDAITCAMHEIAAEQSIPYLKLVTHDFIGAAGFSPDDPTALSRIANTALAARDRLTALFEASGRDPDFRLGIHYGTAIAGALGDSLRIFNLWGEAADAAQIMATSAHPGAIQTTEAAYLRLRQGFLLRPRGTFYLSSLGTTRTFILSGRL